MADIQTLDDIALTKAAARNLLGNMLETQKAVMAESSATSRWLTASLLAVNAGAAVSIFNAADHLGRSGFDMAPFVSGVFAALATGVLSQRVNTKGLAMIGKTIGYAIVTAETGVYTSEATASITAMEPKLRRMARAPIAAGWASALLFGVGALVTATDHRVRPADTPSQARAAISERISSHG